MYSRSSSSSVAVGSWRRSRHYFQRAGPQKDGELPPVGNGRILITKGEMFKGGYRTETRVRNARKVYVGVLERVVRGSSEFGLVTWCSRCRLPSVEAYSDGKRG